MELQVMYQQEVLGSIFNIYGTVEQPLFLAKDVATMIEHSNVTVMLDKVDEDEKVLNNVYTLGGSQESWFLTEEGLYEVLMQSRKPIAKQFKKKVKEILKKLRLGEIQIIEGGNTMSNELITKDMQTLVQSVVESNNNTATCMQQMVQMTQTTQQMMGMLMELLQNNTHNIQQNNNTNKPSTDDEYILSCIRCSIGKNYSMTQIAKDITKDLNINCNATRLNKFLVEQGILVKVKGFEYKDDVYNNFYVFTEDYREQCTTILYKQINNDSNKPYFANSYNGKTRCFIIKYIMNNIDSFKNS